MTVVDGRTRRGERNREAIIDALIACYDDGILRPSVQEVADRAGVSARSVHNHFVDVEALRAEVAQRQWERCSPFVVALDPTQPVPDRVGQLVDLRSALYEEVTPVRRAALLSIDESPTIAANLARLDRARCAGRSTVRSTSSPRPSMRSTRSRRGMPGTACGAAQGCSVARARRILTRTIRTLIEGDACDERDQAQQATVRRVDGSARRRSRRDAQPVEVQGTSGRRRRERRERVRQVQRRGGADGRGARRQGALDGPRRRRSSSAIPRRSGTPSALVQYPSRKDFVEMVSTPEYEQAHEHRESGLERTMLIACTERVSRLS